MRGLIALVLMSACAEPVVEMQIVLPKNADTFDTSCLTAVEVRVNGTTYPQDKQDRRRSCIEVTAGSTYASVRDAIRGKFELSIPETGLGGIEIYGWSGPTPCRDDLPPFVTPDLLFFGKGDYIGQDRVDIPLVPNVSCTLGDVKVRLVDMFALIGGATCTEAMTVPDNEAGAGVGTLVPKLFGKGTDWYGNFAGAASQLNLASFKGLTQVGTRSCLAIDGGSLDHGSTSCVVGGPSVCAGPGEIEHASLSYDVLEVVTNYDSTLMVQFPGILMGSVWSAARQPLAGAKVEIDPKHGKVVYVDPPPAGSGLLGIRGDQSANGPSGMFVLYTGTVIPVKVTGGGATRTVMLGSADNATAGAMIVMPP